MANFVQNITKTFYFNKKNCILFLEKGKKVKISISKSILKAIYINYNFWIKVIDALKSSKLLHFIVSNVGYYDGYTTKSDNWQAQYCHHLSTCISTFRSNNIIKCKQPRCRSTKWIITIFVKIIIMATFWQWHYLAKPAQVKCYFWFVGQNCFWEKLFWIKIILFIIIFIDFIAYLTSKPSTTLSFQRTLL